MVNVYAEIEFSFLSLDFCRTYYYIFLAFFELDSSRVFSLASDGRHKGNLVLVKLMEVLFFLTDFEDGHLGVEEGLSEGVVVVAALEDWKTTSSLSHAYHDFAVVYRLNKELGVSGILFKVRFFIFARKPTAVLVPLTLESYSGPIFREIIV